MSSEGPLDNIQSSTIRLCNLRLNNDEVEDAAVGGEAENAEAYNDSPQNMQPAGNIVLNRARRAVTFAVDEEQANARVGEPSTSNCDK